MDDRREESVEDCGGGVGIRSLCCADEMKDCAFGLEDRGGEWSRYNEDDE